MVSVMNSETLEKFETLDNLIGKTPMAEISLKYKSKFAKVYAKLEYYNYTGSIKDRVALRIIRRAYEAGVLKEGDIICEGTSGNTGIAISAIGAFLGNPVTIFMPDWMTKERVYLIKGMGANIRLISQEEGGLDVMLPLTEQYAKEHGAFQTRQFANKDNVLAHYNGTATEIVEQLAKFGKKADGFVAGIGTGGTFVGIASYLKDNVAGVKVYPLEPDLSLLLSGKMTHSEQHLIHGIGDGFIPDIIKDFKFDEAIAVNDKDSVIMAQMLGKSLGLGVGISSGANLLGAIKVMEEIGFDKTVVTTFADDNKKYLSSEYSEHFEMKDTYLSKDVELLDMRAISYK